MILINHIRITFFEIPFSKTYSVFDLLIRLRVNGLFFLVVFFAQFSSYFATKQTIDSKSD